MLCAGAYVKHIRLVVVAWDVVFAVGCCLALRTPAQPRHLIHGLVAGAHVCACMNRAMLFVLRCLMCSAQDCFAHWPALIAWYAHRHVVLHCFVLLAAQRCRRCCATLAMLDVSFVALLLVRLSRDMILSCSLDFFMFTCTTARRWRYNSRGSNRSKFLRHASHSLLRCYVACWDVRCTDALFAVLFGWEHDYSCFVRACACLHTCSQSAPRALSKLLAERSTSSLKERESALRALPSIVNARESARRALDEHP